MLQLRTTGIKYMKDLEKNHMLESAFNSPYTMQDGELYHTDSRGTVRKVGDGGNSIAMAYDREDGILHCHGAYRDVSKWYDTTCASLSKSSSTKALADSLELVEMPLQIEYVREMNRCISVTGVVSGVAARLSALYAPSSGGLAFVPPQNSGEAARTVILHGM